MEGLIFYWVAWFFWIIATFFMKKESTLRLKITVCALMSIILTPYDAVVSGLDVNIGAIFLLIAIISQVIQFNKMTVFYIFLSSFIVTLAYVSFLLFELNDPVWVVINRNIMLACALGYLCVFLQSNKLKRIYTLVIGMINGEFVFSKIMKKYTFDYPIGSGHFLDALSICMVILVVWNWCELLTVSIGQQMEQNVRGKQKST